MMGLANFVIPGRTEGANPESRNKRNAGIWIPGPALARRPGMTEVLCRIGRNQ
jgi:hypothetical protein